MAASSRGRDPLAHSTKAKDPQTSVQRRDTTNPTSSPSLNKKAQGQGHREAERKERSRDAPQRTTSDSTRREGSDSTRRGTSRDRLHEQDRQRQQRQGENMQANKGGVHSSQPSKPPAAAVAPSTSSSSTKPSTKIEKPHRDSRGPTASVGEHGEKRSDRSRHPAERGSRKVERERERTSESKESRDGRRITPGKERERTSGSKERERERKSESKESRERERKSDSREREGRSESKGRSREGDKRTQSKVSDLQDSKDQGKTAATGQKKILVHEDPPVAKGGAVGGVAREGGGRGEREEQLQPMMVVEDGYSYDEDFEVSLKNNSEICSEIDFYLYQSYEEDFEDDEEEENGSEDSSSGKAVIMKAAGSQWEEKGEGEGGLDKEELTELMAALENENQLAREHSNAQVSKIQRSLEVFYYHILW